MKARVRLLALGCCLAAAGCAAPRADRYFAAGDYGAAIDAYETYLVRRATLSRRDAPILLRVALAHAEESSPAHDPERAEHYLRLLIDLFPDSREAREAGWLLEARTARRLADRLESELELRDERLARLDAVLRHVAETEIRLRSEVESRDAVRADLEARLEALSRRARALASEVAALESELDALKRIDTEGARDDSDGSP